MKRISTEIDRLQTMQRNFTVRNQFVSSTPTYKILRFPAIWFLLFFTLFFTACELPDRDNPWDEKATVDASNWSADGFQIQDVTLTSKKLSWTYQGDNRIEGFQIDRKIGAGEWQEEVYFAGKDERQWVDTNILPDSTKTYTYRLTAVAGVKKSNERTGTVSVRFPGPTALSLQVSTDTTFLLSWTYSSNGHEGFKIDRRKDNEAWQEAVGTVANTQSTFSTKFSSGSDYYYKVYAYYKEYRSAVVTDSLIFPVLTTTTASDITSATAISGGTISRGTAILSRGVCWSTSQNPNVSLSTKTTDGSGTGTYTSSITGLQSGTSYYVRAYATNSVGTAYGSQISFSTPTLSLPLITTISISNITSTFASSGGDISSDGGASVTSRGVCWSTSQNPTVSLSTKTTDGSGTGSFVSAISGLQPGTTYFVRAYATNAMGTAYGSQVSFITTIAPAVSTVTSTTGKVWMDRNLGASRVAISSTDDQAYGDLYQWGRDTDGHEKRTSQTTSTLSSSDTPGHGKFITTSTSPYDWRSPQNNNLWQGVNGTNNPCPEGFRIPTAAEWDAERASWSSRNSAGAFASPIKLPVAGARYDSSGSLDYVGSGGYYWSGTVGGTFAQYLLFNSGGAFMNGIYRAYGFSVRCLKDFPITEVMPSVTTASTTNITISSASSGGNVTDNGGAAVTTRGVVWSTSQNPTVSLSTKTTDGSGTGSFTSSLSGLQPGTTYYVRAYATNSVGTAYGSQVSFTTTSAPAVSTVTSTTGKVWMDRNLGASRVAISSTDDQAYGDLYQWGRDTDGHEKRTSQTTSTLSSSDTPGHGKFITTSTSPYDWRSPQNNNLWQGVNGTNNPCPEGFRIPTAAEWDAERASWSSRNSAGAFASPIKLPVAGYRLYSYGSLYSVGSGGYYWAGTVLGSYAQYLGFGSGDALMFNDSRAYGNSVRCLKD